MVENVQLGNVSTQILSLIIEVLMIRRLYVVRDQMVQTDNGLHQPRDGNRLDMGPMRPN